MQRLTRTLAWTQLVSLSLALACAGSDKSGVAGGQGGAAPVSGGAASHTGGTSSPGMMSSGGMDMLSSGGTGMISTAGSTMMTDGGADAMGGASGASPQAPVIQSVTSMGGLHVAWTNVTDNCDKIELLRNKDGGDFGLIYTLTGAATSQHDSGAMPPGTYCYKARCVIGTQMSPESAEKCGTL